MCNLPRKFNHCRTGIKDDGIPRFDHWRRCAGDGMFFRQAALHFLMGSRLGRNKPVEGHTAVCTADNTLLIEFYQVSTNRSRRRIGYRHQLINGDQIMAFQVIHDLL